MRHRDAWAVDKTAPTESEWNAQLAAESAPEKKRASAVPERRKVAVAAPKTTDDEVPKEILVVVSKLKKYIKARSGMSTSDTVLQPLSDHLRKLCDNAVRRAGESGRRTVMDRDVDPLYPGLKGD